MSQPLLPESHLDLLDEPIVVLLATLMPDGQPQVTPVWCERNGNQIWVNTAVGRQKARNMQARPQVTIAVVDPNNSYRWLEIRGHVVGYDDGEEARAHINRLAMKYLGRPFAPRDPSEQRIIFKIVPIAVNQRG